MSLYSHLCFLNELRVFRDGRTIICVLLFIKIYSKCPISLVLMAYFQFFALAAGSIHADGSSRTAHALYGSQAD